MNRFPHPNIRSVLSLHGKVSPEKAFLIHHTSDGRREELPFAEVSARVHQTANLLQEDLNAQPGDCIAVLVDNPADAVIF
ncbi:hypothetical protein, partial [Salmonella sp. SAL4431]|uniref:hypothetical protein n=1 Tax=Salmonella sp. SAL4431 TaxID=3159886 RepID=UPI0039796089